jgi:hypothetical protein
MWKEVKDCQSRTLLPGLKASVKSVAKKQKVAKKRASIATVKTMTIAAHGQSLSFHEMFSRFFVASRS